MLFYDKKFVFFLRSVHLWSRAPFILLWLILSWLSLDLPNSPCFLFIRSLKAFSTTDICSNIVQPPIKDYQLWSPYYCWNHHLNPHASCLLKETIAFVFVPSKWEFLCISVCVHCFYFCLVWYSHLTVWGPSSVIQIQEDLLAKCDHMYNVHKSSLHLYMLMYNDDASLLGLNLFFMLTSSVN